jgi:cytochrome c-type biogenesis protein CcmH
MLRWVALAAVVSLVALPTAAAAAASPRASLTDIENDVMCVSCREPLAVAQSPQAEAERDYIRSLIGQDETKAQIERELVAQYGSAVLGRPPAHGFNLTVYIVPPAILLLGIATLALTLPQWRRRARVADESAVSDAPPLSPTDASRLDEELSRYGG